jgi:hypothetical protein
MSKSQTEDTNKYDPDHYHKSTALSFPFLDTDGDNGRLGELAVNEANRLPPLGGPAFEGELLPLVRVGEPGREIFARVGDMISFEFASVSRNSTQSREKDCKRSSITSA